MARGFATVACILSTLTLGACSQDWKLERTVFVEDIPSCVKAVDGVGYVTMHTPNRNTTCIANFEQAKSLTPSFASKTTCEANFGLGNCLEKEGAFSPEQVGVIIYAKTRTGQYADDTNAPNLVEPVFFGPSQLVLGPDALPRRYTATRLDGSVQVEKFVPRISQMKAKSK